MPTKATSPSIRKHSGAVIYRTKKYSVIDCRQCGFKHLDPIPSPAQLSGFYSQKFYAQKKPNYFKHAQEDLSWWRQVYNNYFKLLERHTRGRKLLDIGSGPGYFLKCGQERGWQGIGFEPSQQAFNYSLRLGIKAINSNFNLDQAKKNGPFDAVSLLLVLEHLADPLQLLKNLKKILKPGGLLLIVSPNDFNPFQQILNQNLKLKPWWIVYPDHINYFDFKSLKKTLSRLGFESIDLLTSFPMEFFLLSGDNYINRPGIGRKCHRRRKIFETNLYHHNPALLNKLYRSLAKNSLGREIVIIAKNE